MNKRHREPTLSDLLRQAIAESGLSHNALAQATGVTLASILRFARGDQSLRLDKADLLAAYFGLTLTKKGQESWALPFLSARRVEKGLQPSDHLADLLD